MKNGIPPVGMNLTVWANDLRRWLARSWDALSFKDATAQASQDGVMLWDAAGYPVVSKAGEWRQVLLADGYGVLVQDADITAAAINTAYALAWDAPAMADGVTVVSSSRVTFEEAGVYLLAFSAQIKSSTASTVTFWFWPRVNGTDIPGSTMSATLHTSGSTFVASRSALFTVTAGQYLEAMWAVDNTNGYLQATAATAFAPAAPSVALSVVRIRQ